MKKFLLLTMALFLVGCTPNEEPEVVEPVVEETDIEAPVITILDTATLKNDDTFNLNDYVSVEDESSFTVESNFDEVVNFEENGEYEVTVTVTDEFDNKTEAKLFVVVNYDKVAPEITVLDNPTLWETEFDAKDYVRVKEGSQYDLTTNFDEVVDLDIAGDYTITLTAEDVYGNVGTAEMTVTVLPNETIFLRANLPIGDYSNDYDLEATHMNVYSAREDHYITYVNIEEFITTLTGAVIPLNVEKTDTLRVSYTYEYDEEDQELLGQEEFTYEMIFDAEANTVYFNDVDFLDSLDDSPETDYSQGLEIVSVDIADIDYSKTIDLNKYNFDIVLHEENYYIPLYLANFFLTGFSTEIAEVPDSLYLIDYRTYNEEEGTEAEGYTDTWKNVDSTPLSAVQDDTYNFLALWFDVMYGLREFKGITDVYEWLEGYPDLLEAKTTTKYYSEMNRLINELDDLHSSFNYAGPRKTGYTAASNYYKDGTTLNGLYDTLDVYACDFDAPDVEFSVVDNVAIVKVNGYGLDFPELFEPVMEEASQYDDIVFDVSCNLGGLVSSSIYMLTFMTDETVYIYDVDPYTGGTVAYGYKSEVSHYIPANYYIFTSNATFSAGNLFTNAVKDNELATIIGDQTLGGACAVQYALTPDGAVFQNSSNYASANKDGEVIEGGVEPDYWLTERNPGKNWMQTLVEYIKANF